MFEKKGYHILVIPIKISINSTFLKLKKNTKQPYFNKFVKTMKKRRKNDESIPEKKNSHFTTKA